MSDIKQDPFLVMIELVKGLNSKEAEDLLVRAMSNNIEAAGLLARRDTLLFLKPIYSALSKDFDAKLEVINKELDHLNTQDKETFDKFHSMIEKLTSTGDTHHDI